MECRAFTPTGGRVFCHFVPPQNGFAAPPNGWLRLQNDLLSPQNDLSGPQNDLLGPQKGWLAAPNGLWLAQNGSWLSQNGWLAPQNGIVPPPNAGGALFCPIGAGIGNDGSGMPFGRVKLSAGKRGLGGAKPARLAALLLPIQKSPVMRDFMGTGNENNNLPSFGQPVFKEA